MYNITSIFIGINENIHRSEHGWYESEKKARKAFRKLVRKTRDECTLYHQVMGQRSMFCYIHSLVYVDPHQPWKRRCIEREYIEY